MIIIKYDTIISYLIGTSSLLIAYMLTLNVKGDILFDMMFIFSLMYGFFRFSMWHPSKNDVTHTKRKNEFRIILPNFK